MEPEDHKGDKRKSGWPFGGHTNGGRDTQETEYGSPKFAKKKDEENEQSGEQKK